MADLETIAVTCASLISFYYGILGITIVCTSDCTGETMQEGGEAVVMSPLSATLYCIMALVTGWVLWLLRDHMRNAKLSSNLTTFSAAVGHATAQGQAWHALAMRYGVISFCLFGVVMGLLKFKLIGPLQHTAGCEPLPPSQIGSFWWTVRNFLENMEWIIYLVLGLFLMGFLFAMTERNKFERAAAGLGYTPQQGSGIGQATNSLFGGATPTYNAVNQGSYASGGYGPASLEQLRAQGPHPQLQVQQALEKQAEEFQKSLHQQAQQHAAQLAAAHARTGQHAAGVALDAHGHPIGTTYVSTASGFHPHVSGVTPVTPATPGHASPGTPGTLSTPHDHITSGVQAARTIQSLYGR